MVQPAQGVVQPPFQVGVRRLIDLDPVTPDVDLHGDSPWLTTMAARMGRLHLEVYAARPPRKNRFFRLVTAVFPGYRGPAWNGSTTIICCTSGSSPARGASPAGELLGLAQPTVSGQVRELEHSLGEKLLQRVGRNLALTEKGRMVFAYADQIFKLGQELQGAVKGQAAGGPLKLVVGVADVLPKRIVYRLLSPVRQLGEPVRIVCREGKPDRLLDELAAHNLDVVLSDAPADPLVKAKVYNHLLGECGLSFFAAGELARKLKRDFPRSLDHAPMLLPTEDAAVRRALEQWLRSHDLSPRVVGEFEDSALLKIFGESGAGVFALPTVIEEEVCRRHGVRVIGRVDSLRVRCYAITAERRLSHPAVAALSAAARQGLFDAGTI